MQSTVEEEKKIDTEYLERLKSYKSVNTLRKAMLNVLVKMLKPNETREVADAFNKLDRDKTGLVNISELAETLKKTDASLNHNDAKDIISELDFAQNGKINYSEFLSACIDLEEVLKDDDRLKAIYNQFDADGSEYINEDDIKAALGVMGKKIDQDEINDLLSR